MDPNERPCTFCNASTDDSAAVRGRGVVICRSCVGRGLVSSMAPRTGLELPEADTPCALCEGNTPDSALFRGNVHDARICTSCLARSYAFLADTAALRGRREDFAHLGERSLASLIRDHFAAVGLDDVVTAVRSFPEYTRVDVHRTLDQALSGSPCHGVYQQYAHDTLTFAAMLQAGHGGEATVAPLQYDELDVGEAQPARCLKSGLWFAADPCPHVVLMTKDQTYGRSVGWHVEIAVPKGPRGSDVARALFEAIETAVAGSTTYRGKVISLDRDPHMRGTSATVAVHRLPSVDRSALVLPDPTLRLLERNVFDFVARRERLRQMGLPTKKGLLFYGPPGTGKTHTLRYLAGALPDHTTLLVTADQVGLIADYMVLARLLAPSVLVIEDADLIARERERIDATCEEVLLNKLLNEMDGLRPDAEILFVLTTNRPQALEAALTARPGRIDQAIEFPLPDAAGRRKLALLYGRGATVGEEALARIVERTDRTSAAFIKELMRRAAQFALHRDDGATIGAADVDEALEELLFAGGRLNAALLGAAGAVSEDSAT